MVSADILRTSGTKDQLSSRILERFGLRQPSPLPPRTLVVLLEAKQLPVARMASPGVLHACQLTALLV